MQFTFSLGLRALLALLPLSLAAPAMAQDTTHLGVSSSQLVQVRIYRLGASIELSPTAMTGCLLTRPDGTSINWAFNPIPGMTLVILDLTVDAYRPDEDLTKTMTYVPRIHGYNRQTRSSAFAALPLPVACLKGQDRSNASYAFPGGMAYSAPLSPRIILDTLKEETLYIGHGYLVPTK